HKALVTTTVAFLGLLLVGGAVTAWQAVQLARADRDQAGRQGPARRGRAEAPGGRSREGHAPPGPGPGPRGAGRGDEGGGEGGRRGGSGGRRGRRRSGRRP